MTPDAWITVAVLTGAFVVLATDRLAPSAVVLTSTVVLLLANVIDAGQALSGFSNPAPITVAALYVLARAADATSLLTPLAGRLLGRGTRRRDLARLLVPVAGASSFLNNTPLVAMLTPDIVALGARRNLSPSRFLMPLSFAAILGGTVTLLGTSTNLVVSGLLEESGAAPLGLFELTPVALPAAVIGMALLLALSWWLVPERVSAQQRSAEQVREYVAPMVVVGDGPLVGQRLAATPLVDRPNVWIAEVVRGSETFLPVDVDLVLEADDRIVFVGEMDQVVDLYRVAGLHSGAHARLDQVARKGDALHVAVVGNTSRLTGRTLAEVDFRRRYDGVVLAIHRDGHRITQDPRDVRFRVGDALVVLAEESFRQAWADRRDFLMISRIGLPSPRMAARAPLVAVITIGMVVLAATGVATALEASLIAAGALVATRTLSADEVRDAIDFDVIILVAASFGLGAAVQATGLADVLAGGVIDAFDGLGTVGVVVGLLVAMTLLTELVTNNAAVVVVFPIAASVAASTGVDFRVLAIGMAVVASCSFLTPIGYQTNTIVYGPGGYRFTDYARLGLPLNAVVVAVTASMVMVLGT